MDKLFFQDNNQLYSINLNKGAYEQILYYCTGSNPYETGGVLIGDYSSNQATANILQITPPPKDSRYSKCNFHRGANGLKKVLDSAWNRGQYYLGEWHYHPNVFAKPSNTDINQMIVLSKNKRLKCPEPILIIIGGHYDDWNIHVSVFTNKDYTILNQIYK